MSRINYFQRVLPEMVARGDITKGAATEVRNAYREASERLGNPVVMRESDIPEPVRAGKEIYEQGLSDDFFRDTPGARSFDPIEGENPLRSGGRHWLLQRPEDVDLNSPDAYDWYLSRANYFEHVLPRMVRDGEITSEMADSIRETYELTARGMGLPVVMKKDDIPESVRSGEAAALRRRAIRKAHSGYDEDLSDITDIDLITGDRSWLLNKPDSGLDSPDSYRWYMSRINFFNHVLPRQARGGDVANIVSRHKAAYSAAAQRLGIPVAFDQSDIPETVRAGRQAYDSARRTEQMQRQMVEVESLRTPETRLQDVRSVDRLTEIINARIAESGAEGISIVQKRDLLRRLLDNEDSTIQDLNDAIDELTDTGKSSGSSLEDFIARLERELDELGVESEGSDREFGVAPTDEIDELDEIDVESEGLDEIDVESEGLDADEAATYYPTESERRSRDIERLRNELDTRRTQLEQVKRFLDSGELPPADESTVWIHRLPRSGNPKATAEGHLIALEHRLEEIEREIMVLRGDDPSEFDAMRVARQRERERVAVERRNAEDAAAAAERARAEDEPDDVTDVPEESGDAESAGDPDGIDEEDHSGQWAKPDADDSTDSNRQDSDSAEGDDVGASEVGDDGQWYVDQALERNLGRLRFTSRLRDRFTTRQIANLVNFLGGSWGRGARSVAGVATGVAVDMVAGFTVLAALWGVGRTWEKLRPFIASSSQSELYNRTFEILANDALQKGTLRGFRFGRSYVKPEMAGDDGGGQPEFDVTSDDFWR